MVCKCLFGTLLSFVLDVNLEEGLLDHMVSSIFNFWGTITINFSDFNYHVCVANFQIYIHAPILLSPEIHKDRNL